MATQTTVTLVDDLDGTEATETLTFGLDGTTYEIDVNDENAQKLRDALAAFVGAARVADDSSRRRGPGRPRGSRRGGSRSVPDRDQTMAIRTWARAAGYSVSDRGRLSSSIIEAFEAAHN